MLNDETLKSTPMAEIPFPEPTANQTEMALKQILRETKMQNQFLHSLLEESHKANKQVETTNKLIEKMLKTLDELV